jgi:hypothetical protein
MMQPEDKLEQGWRRACSIVALVGSDDELGEEFVRQGIKVLSVELAVTS